MNVLEKDTEALILYTNDFYEDVSLPQQFSKYEQEDLANKMGMKLNTLLWYISRNHFSDSHYHNKLYHLKNNFPYR